MSMRRAGPERRVFQQLDSRMATLNCRARLLLLRPPPMRPLLRSLSSSASILSPALSSLKSRQHAALEDLERQLVKMKATDKDCAVLRDCAATLAQLFLLCTVGEFNAGKSTIINALLGTEHCATGVVPTTAAVTLLRHPSASSLAGGSMATGVVAVDVPTPWLQDVSIVDTPGTNTLDASHTALTQDFLPRADGVIFITSAERPLPESEMTFLREIRAWGKKVLFVLNKADVMGSADELKQVVGYVEEHACRELGRTPLPCGYPRGIQLIHQECPMGHGHRNTHGAIRIEFPGGAERER